MKNFGNESCFLLLCLLSSYENVHWTLLLLWMTLRIEHNQHIVHTNKVVRKSALLIQISRRSQKYLVKFQSMYYSAVSYCDDEIFLNYFPIVKI